LRLLPTLPPVWGFRHFRRTPVALLLPFFPSYRSRAFLSCFHAWRHVLGSFSCVSSSTPAGVWFCFFFMRRLLKLRAIFSLCRLHAPLVLLVAFSNPGRTVGDVLLRLFCLLPPRCWLAFFYGRVLECVIGQSASLCVSPQFACFSFLLPRARGTVLHLCAPPFTHAGLCLFIKRRLRVGW